VLETLAPFGITSVPWIVEMPARGSEEVNSRLTAWSEYQQPGPTFLYWLGHGWANDVEGVLAHARSPESIRNSGIATGRLANAIIDRQGGGEGDGRWCVVVIETCKSYNIAELVLNEIIARRQKVKDILLIGVSSDGGTNLGKFSHALAQVVTRDFGSVDEIPIERLGPSLKETLDDPFATYFQPSSGAALIRTTPTAVAVALDGQADLNAAFAELPDAEREHFLAWGAHADLGEASWYLEGREQERREIVEWLGQAHSGMFVVTGKAGSGKSALLAETLINTWPGLREALGRRGMIAPLPAAARPADHTFQATLRLTGATFREVIERLGAILNWDAPPPNATNRERLEKLIEQAREAGGVTVLVDSLDESQQPLSIAALLREIAASGGARLLVGTRRSTLEAIDRADLGDDNILRTLTGARSEQASSVLCVERDPEAIAGFVRERLKGVARADVIEWVEAALRKRDAEFLFASLAVHEIQARVPNGDLSRGALARLLEGTHRALFATAVHRISSRGPTHEFALEALGLSLGRGVPLLDGVFGSIAAALADSRVSNETRAIDNDALHTLLNDAAPYVMIDTEDQQTVFRLAHRTYREYYVAAEDLEGEAPPLVGSARHRSIAQRLIALAREAAGPLNPYLARHLTGHLARATPGTWQILADHPRVLDRLDPRATTADAVRAMLDRQELPAEILGVVASKHLLAEGVPGSREGIRQIGMAASSKTREFTREDQSSRWSVRSARLQPHPIHLRLRTHSDAYALAYVSGPEDISLLAAGCDDGKVRLWTAASGEPFGDAIDVSHAPVLALCTYPAQGDGAPRLVTSDSDSQMGIWDPLTGSCEERFAIGNASPARAIAAYRDSSGAQFIVTDGDEYAARVWSAETGELTVEFAGHQGVVRAIACCTVAEQTIIASAGQEDAVRLWNPATGAPLAVLAGHRDWVKSLAPYSTSDGRPHLASGGDDANILLWNLDRLLDSPAGAAPRHAQPIGRLNHRGVRVRALMSYENRHGHSRLVSGGEDGDIRVWDPEKGVQLGRALSGHTDAVVSTVLSSPGATPACVASLGEDQHIRIWDPRMAERIEADEEQVVAVNALAVCSALDGRPLATAGGDGAVRFWSPTTGEHAREPLLGHVGAVRAITTYRDGAGVPRIATVGADESLRIWTPTEHGDVAIVCHGHLRGVRALVSYSDGGTPRLATGGEDGQIWLWDATSGEPVAGPHSSCDGWVRGLDVFADGEGRMHLAAVGLDRDVRLWNLADPSSPLLMHGHTNWVLAVRTYTDAAGTERIATAGDDATMRIWDPLAQTEVACFDRGSAPIRAIDALRDANGAVLLACGDQNGVVWIWDPHAEEEPIKIPLGVPVQALQSFQDTLLVGTTEGHVVLDLKPPSQQVGATVAVS
jgi:WD40 repeat protein